MSRGRGTSPSACSGVRNGTVYGAPSGRPTAPQGSQPSLRAPNRPPARPTVPQGSQPSPRAPNCLSGLSTVPPRAQPPQQPAAAPALRGRCRPPGAGRGPGGAGRGAACAPEVSGGGSPKRRRVLGRERRGGSGVEGAASPLPGRDVLRRPGGGGSALGGNKEQGRKGAAVGAGIAGHH